MLLYFCAVSFLLSSFVDLRPRFAVGGSFFEAYRIAEGNFYIHGAIQFGPRTIPLKDIRSIQVHHVRGRYGLGNRYMVYLERKKGRTITLIVGESARNCRLMESLRADTRKYGIKVYGDIS